MGKANEKFDAKLLVEGTDDLHVISAICNKCAIEENFDIIACGNDTKVIEGMPVRLKEPEIRALGILLDADQDFNSRWKSVKAILKKFDFTVPDMMPPEGLITTNNDRIKAGIWIMPNNKNIGMLEDFITTLIPANDKLLAIADITLQRLEAEKLHKYKEIHRAKARVHTWLAWQDKPGTPLGQAITKQYFSTADHNIILFTDWLKNLFS